jgi:hypothetical protein
MSSQKNKEVVVPPDCQVQIEWLLLEKKLQIVCAPVLILLYFSQDAGVASTHQNIIYPRHLSSLRKASPVSCIAGKVTLIPVWTLT